MGFADEVKDKAQGLGDRASDALDVAKDRFEDAWDTVSDKAEDAFEVAKDKASGLVDAVTSRFESEPESQPESQPEAVEDFAAAGPVPEDPMDRAVVVEDAAAETERHFQPGQL